MSLPSQTPRPNQQPFARTNIQTIAQRVAIIRELFPQLNSIAEICCGDCSQQPGNDCQKALALVE